MSKCMRHGTKGLFAKGVDGYIFFFSVRASQQGSQEAETQGNHNAEFREKSITMPVSTQRTLARAERRNSVCERLLKKKKNSIFYQDCLHYVYYYYISVSIIFDLLLVCYTVITWDYEWDIYNDCVIMIVKG